MCISVGYSGKTCKTIAHFLNGIQQKRQCMWNSSDRTESKITHILKGLKQAHQMRQRYKHGVTYFLDVVRQVKYSK